MTERIHHEPGPIVTPPSQGVQGPDGEYLSIAAALSKCSCGKVHVAASEESYGSPYNSAIFQLGVKFAQLNRWENFIEPITFDDEAPEVT